MKLLSDIETIWAVPWIGWIMLLELFMLGAMEYTERGIIGDAFRSLISPIERRGYNQMETRLITHILGLLFRTSVLGMGLYIVAGDVYHCRPWGWLIAGAMVLGMHGIKLAWAGWINFLFQLTHPFRLIYSHYVAVWTGIAIVVYPCTLAAIRYSGWENLQFLLYIVVGLYLLAMIVKLLRSVTMQWMTIPYILLYALTVEVLPIAGILYIFQIGKL